MNSGLAAPPGLEGFLEAGPPPVLVGFGSIFGSRPAERTTGVALEALRRHAATVGGRLRLENGVQSAVEIIQDVLDRRSPQASGEGTALSEELFDGFTFAVAGHIERALLDFISQFR
jgi:hypothetical protein